MGAIGGVKGVGAGSAELCSLALHADLVKEKINKSYPLVSHKTRELKKKKKSCCITNVFHVNKMYNFTKIMF